MIILNGGVPRSGTVLINGIIRGVLAHYGVAVVQIDAHGDELPNAIRRAEQSGGAAYVIHTHSWDRASAAASRSAAQLLAFASYRDPRDICASLMILHDHKLKDALRMTRAGFANMEAMCRDLDVTVFAYEQLVADRRRHVEHIGRLLGPGLPDDAAEAILEATAIERQRERMAQVRAGTMPGLLVRRNRNRALRADPVTLINDRHIQSGESGRWRRDFSPANQKYVTRALAGIITRYGYPAV